ncbi:hypothetical protein ML065_004814 [Klebsiella pneumoniae]|uniref:hypothetical protein n=1 Tax=Enterobacteriaceae TaxID=543 RepID=UPI0002C40D03|nr:MULTISPECIES: hypothetical protein [Enterobacteriaceae]ALV39589.1 hypothetical protein Kpn2146_6017 [Klebsiella pneumoniae]APR45282.1 hypothetical protein AM428_00640 [Klebsiella pneumoniae]EIX9573315.1 hypothetical protein [Klebsiella pneumoniae]EMR16074.1 hypothetical protein G000_25706 [Klebsiella pneumoniae ATCC BAA-2146]MBH0545836.1 hypothetical protein [Salmonella enterica]
MNNTSNFVIYKIYLRDKDGRSPKGEDTIIYIIYDVYGSRVHSHHINKELEALRECYNLNQGNIPEYNISPKNEDGNVDWSLNEVTEVINTTSSHCDILAVDDSYIKNTILKFFIKNIKKNDKDKGPSV